MKKIVAMSTALVASAFIFANAAKAGVEAYVPETVCMDDVIFEAKPIQITPVNPIKFDFSVVEEDHNDRAFSLSLTENDIREIAQITMAEAENQDEYGKRLVIDTVLNRVNHPSFPNTVHGVIFQSGQFQPVTNGRYYNYWVSDENYKLVKEEVEKRTNYDVIFFQAYNYSPYGTPLFKVGDHYFNKY